MKNVKFRNIAILFLLSVGVSGSIMAIFFPTVDNYFRDVSPLPIIFSYNRNNKRVFYNTEFSVLTKSGKRIETVFNKDLYRYLGGPHRRKIFLHSKLRWQKGINTESFKNLILSFCNPIYAKKVLKTDDQLDSITVGWSNIDIKITVQCP